jgi:uncharacterized protein YkwD
MFRFGLVLGIVLSCCSLAQCEERPVAYNYAIYPHWQIGFTPTYVTHVGGRIPREDPLDKSVVRSDIAISATESRMVKAVNKYRADRKLPPMEVDPILMKVARQRVRSFSHCQNGKWMWDACHDAGFRGWATDDLAQGYRTPEDAVGDGHSGWGDETGHSVGHDKQMKGYFKMNGRWQNYHFDRIGVASTGPGGTWIAVFGVLNNK